MAQSDECVLRVRGVSKSFPGVKALDDVDIDIRRGQVHAFVGENGAGKSTLMKILNGNYTKDTGEILVDGSPVEIKNPQEAKQLGISIIFQEFNLVSTLSVTENIYLGRIPKKGRILDWARAHSMAREVLARIGYDLDPRTLISKLSVAQKQMVEIAKAISYENTRLVLMDEPTATLTGKECDMLFKVIRELKAQEISVIYISHRLEEIFEVCDWVTVLRDGKIIDSQPAAQLTKDDITEKMIGRELSNEFPRREPCVMEEEILRVEGLNRAGVLEDISFALHRGEVLGLAGLVGAGRTEIARAISGIDYVDAGRVTIKGREVKLRNPSDSIRQGMCYLSEDRKFEGLVGNSTVKWNLVMAGIKKVLRGGLISRAKENAMAKRSVDTLAIKTPSLNQIVFNLSGGNQQKIVIGKWLNTDAEVFIFDEPTRGIDVGAKYEIYLIINRLVQEGKSVLMISSELPEILGMCDRVLIVRQGRISAELTGEEITAQDFIKHAI